MDQAAKHKPYGDLGIIALKSFREMGAEVDARVRARRRESGLFGEDDIPSTFLVKTDEVRFSNGEGKVKLTNTVRGKDIYVLCDVGNYSCTYDMYGFRNHMGPDEHFQDIKRTLSAIAGKSRRITVIMPRLYASRQHRRKSRESLDCAMALQELERLGVTSVITFDVHDNNIQNAIPLGSFENLYPTYDMVRALLSREKDLALEKGRTLVISPDTGAMDRAIYYSGVLGTDIGLFYKRRDLRTVINGSNPIITHEYMGRPVEGMDVLIVDDMIASGESVLDIAAELKARNAKRIFVAATFAMFTEGLGKFNEYYERGLFTRVYSTNLTYIPPEAMSAPWFKIVDMSNFLSKLIDTLNCDESVAPLKDATAIIKDLLEDSYGLHSAVPQA
ncbi:MAG: ribose-phosphate pyrophosphokinase [Clostridiales bacterium]|nr:ribose-phosphate pyrophosphokinase [Clostridiales bacterium]MDR2749591.1 ribose-phosphate pyrophosphokinase [Clostridiales bacterium]